MKLRTLIVFTVVAIMCLSMIMASAQTKGYVTEGLVGFFDGSNNLGKSMTRKVQHGRT